MDPFRTEIKSYEHEKAAAAGIKPGWSHVSSTSPRVLVRLKLDSKKLRVSRHYMTFVILQFLVLFLIYYSLIEFVYLEDAVGSASNHQQPVLRPKCVECLQKQTLNTKHS